MTATDLPDTRLLLKFGGSLVEQLGAQLYPSATATVAELISNAWDADARHVWISIPFGDSWSRDSEILVVDDGHGMTRDDAARAYLIVGRKRRLETGEVTDGGRRLHGRKGIGKLAAFGTAGIVECTTLRDNVLMAFRLDYDQIRQLQPDEDYEVEAIDDPHPLVSLDSGEALAHGTRIRLTRLWLKRALSEEQFRLSMSRRFSLGANEMRVLINGQPLERFDMELEFRFPADASPGDQVIVDADGWGSERIPESGEEVRWWIGFAEKPIADEATMGVSILANGKMAQRPFKFERAQGTTGQLGQEYLVGEIEANWLDRGQDVDTDLIQSNRDQLRLEDDRLEAFLAWGRRRIEWALRQRNRLHKEKTIEEVGQSTELQELLKDLTEVERRAYLGVAASLSSVPEVSSEDVRVLLRSVMDAREDVVVRRLIEDISAEDDPTQQRVWNLVRQFGLIDARRTLTLIEGRLVAIERLKIAVAAGAREVPELHDIIRVDAWLLDPRWHLFDDEVNVSSLGIEYEAQTDEAGQRMDFLFVLKPGSPAPVDEVIVVEIKRGTNADLSIRRVSENEIDKFHGYVLAVQDHYEGANTTTPRIRGLMIAQAYSDRANLKRRSLEQPREPRLEFKTWDRVIEETERMHLGWLGVSRLRAAMTTPFEVGAMAPEATDAITT